MDCFATATSLVAHFMTGGDPERFLDGQLRRIRKLAPTLHAFLSVQEAEARKTVQERCTARASSRALYCLPYALKDNIDAAGVRTTCHSATRVDHIALEDSEVKRRLDQAGAVYVGKTALHEFALGGPSFDLPWPPARNPWDEQLHPGGSSSGSAVAVASGQVAFAIGTDTAGSVRHPATVCGLYGFKPTYDTINMRGVVPLSDSLDHLGILARSARDIALVASVIYDRATYRQACAQLVQGSARALKGLRVGVLDAFSLDLACDPQIRAAFLAFLRALETAGCSLVHLQAPDLPTFGRTGRTLIHAEAYDHFGTLLEAGHAPLSTKTRRRLQQGREHTLRDYIEALRERRRLTEILHSRMATVDIAVCLSSQYLPCGIRDERALTSTYAAQARTPFNLTGLPALAIPIGLSSEGLPIGIQLGAQAGHDASLIATAIAMEHQGLCGFLPPVTCNSPPATTETRRQRHASL